MAKENSQANRDALTSACLWGRPSSLGRKVWISGLYLGPLCIIIDIWQTFSSRLSCAWVPRGWKPCLCICWVTGEPWVLGMDAVMRLTFVLLSRCFFKNDLHGEHIAYILHKPMTLTLPRPCYVILATLNTECILSFGIGTHTVAVLRSPEFDLLNPLILG